MTNTNALPIRSSSIPKQPKNQNIGSTLDALCMSLTMRSNRHNRAIDGQGEANGQSRQEWGATWDGHPSMHAMLDWCSTSKLQGRHHSSTSKRTTCSTWSRSRPDKTRPCPRGWRRQASRKSLRTSLECRCHQMMPNWKGPKFHKCDFRGR